MTTRELNEQKLEIEKKCFYLGSYHRHTTSYTSVMEVSMVGDSGDHPIIQWLVYIAT